MEQSVGMGLIVVSNRVASPSAGAAPGGLASALLQGIARSGGVWYGWSGKTVADPGQAYQPAVTRAGKAEFVTVDYPQRAFEGFYNGMANATLWPIMHSRPDLMQYETHFLEDYRAVNHAVADSLLRFVQLNSIIWIHDYHFLMVAQQLRARGVTQPIGFFLHTPFAHRSTIECLPHHQALFEPLLAYDLLGFQTDRDLAAFSDYAVEVLGAVRRDAETLEHDGALIRLAVFAVGIDVDEYSRLADMSENNPSVGAFRRALAEVDTIIGVDRLDYSKGLPQRFAAFERLLVQHPERRNRVSFLQIAPPSRSSVQAYRDLRTDLAAIAGDINGRWSSLTWTPLRYTNETYASRSLAGFFRVSRVCCVTPLRDGMNLVAKEYVAAQDPDDPGVLVLSEFAGAARELDAALIVNPYDIDGVARALERALSMSLGERLERWMSMADILRHNDVAAWFDGFIAQLKRTRSPDRVLVKIA
jgi:trehalose 6-phosphate synthase